MARALANECRNIMPIFDKRYLEYVQSNLRGKMAAQHTPTSQSWIYRKRAAALARDADAAFSVEEQVRLVKEALNWIQLAENEEYMALNAPRANDN
jgi:hypothetical protein